ncbi:uncharacterized protein RHO17_006531 isoform 2-T2 [Thomomys bottae]
MGNAFCCLKGLSHEESKTHQVEVSADVRGSDLTRDVKYQEYDEMSEATSGSGPTKDGTDYQDVDKQEVKKRKRKKFVTFMINVIRRPLKVAPKPQKEVHPHPGVLSTSGILKDSSRVPPKGQSVKQKEGEKKKKSVSFMIDQIQRPSNLAPGSQNEVNLFQQVLSTPGLAKDAQNVPVETSTKIVP